MLVEAPTGAEDSFVPGAGEVITLAEGPIDLAKFALEAGALVAAALAAPAAQRLALCLPAQVLVPALALPFLALAPGTQEARVALTQAADVSPVVAAPGAVGFQPGTAAAPAVVGDPHLQAVPEAHGPQGEHVLCVFARAAPGLHRHLKGRLGRRKRGDIGAVARLDLLLPVQACPSPRVPSTVPPRPSVQGWDQIWPLPTRREAIPATRGG